MGDTFSFRLWPPVAIGLPLLVGWAATARWGDPLTLGEWRVSLGWALLAFSRNPLYVGLLALYLALALLAPSVWALALFPAAVLLMLWGAVRPEKRFLHEQPLESRTTPTPTRTPTRTLVAVRSAARGTVSGKAVVPSPGLACSGS